MIKVRLIAFYLPQYHQIPENDKWWGEGFTDWTNVKKAKSFFNGHKPHQPSEDIGYYDLKNIETIEKQSKMAQENGVHGFCFYHYWFGGKKLLETPLQNVLASKKIDIPFCVCWANENWTRRWDGQDDEILISQKHSDKDDLAFINDLIPTFKDSRYIKINKKPLLVIYRTSLFPDIKKSASIWRKAVKKAGLEGLYLVRVEGLEDSIDPKEINFDAAIEFAPDWRLKETSVNTQENMYSDFIKDKKVFSGKGPELYDYNLVVNNMISREVPEYKYFRGAFPSWDNTPRRGSKGAIFWGSNAKIFQYFVSKQIKNTQKNKVLNVEEKFVFLNAWNEWGEGCHIEPDKESGYSNLLAIKSAVAGKSNPDIAPDLYYSQIMVLEEKRKKLDLEVIKLSNKNHFLRLEKNELENDNINAHKYINQLELEKKTLELESNVIKNSGIWKMRNILAKIMGKKIV